MSRMEMSGRAATTGEMLPCPTCNGDGFAQFDGSVRETRTDVCITCRGARFVPANTGMTPETSAPPLSWLGEGTRMSVRRPED